MPGDGTRALPGLRQRRSLIIVVAVAVLAAAGGWLAGQSIRSPDEMARTAAAPPASLITAPVELRVLETAVVVRGDVGRAQPVEVKADTGMTGESGAAGGLVVTGQIPSAGAKLDEGDVALEISGRPILLLEGALPAYRALGPGDSGPDVRQLEAALRRLGFRPGKVDGSYDLDTQAAVTRWYRSAGYRPVGPSPEEQDRLLGSSDRVRAARDAVDAAAAALAAAGAGPPRSAVVAAQGKVSTAAAAVELAVRDRATAIAAAPPAQRERVRIEQDALVEAARTEHRVAQAELRELTAARDTVAERKALTNARADLVTAQRAYDQLQGATGIRIPRGEVVFVASLPRRVDKVLVKLGAEPTGAVLSLSATDLQVTCSVTAADRDLVQVGAEATLDEPALGIETTALVTSVAETPADDGAPAGTYQVRLTPARGGPAELDGANVRVRIPVRSTEDEVFVAPVAALFSDAGGVTRVRVLDDAGGTAVTDVQVRLGLSADGFTEITPIDDELAEGDQLVVGRQ